MNEASALAKLLSIIGLIFAHVTEEEYGNASENGAWQKVQRAAARFARDDAERVRFARDLALPAWPERSALQNSVLVGGMPLAALPVESLYKPWSGQLGNAYGAQRGLYLGDPARHLQEVYAALAIKVPARFAVTPDHLTLELELMAMLLEAGNEEAACELAADHLDWLGDYDAALAARADQAAQASALDEAQRAVLVQGIAHLRALVTLVEVVAERVMQPASVP